MSPREHHRFFAKQLIPTHTFQSTEKMFAELTGPKREAFLMYLWNEAGNAVASPIAHVAVEEGRLAKLEVVGTTVHGPSQVIALSMPPAIAANEAAFIALARGPAGTSVLFLERTLDGAGTGVDAREAVLAELRADGSRVNHGFAPGLDLETFKRRVGAVVGYSLQGIESSLPEITAAGFVGAGQAGAPRGVAAATGGHVGGLLATLLLIRGGVPVLLWALAMVNLYWLGALLGPVLRIGFPLLSLVIGVLMLVWLYQVHARRRGQASFSPGMAVGGWFIPVANVVLPPLIVRSAWKATVGAGGGLLAFGWWLAWLLETFLTVLRGQEVTMSKATPGEAAISFSGVSFHAPEAVGDALFFALHYGVFITAAAYGLLYYIVRRVSAHL